MQNLNLAGRRLVFRMVVLCLVVLAGRDVGAQEWTVGIRVEEPDVQIRLMQFGVANGATGEVDIALGEVEFPPLPPSGAFDSRFTTPMGLGLALDLRPPGATEYSFLLRLQWADNADPMLLSWDPSGLPAGIDFRIQDVAGGSSISVDMKTQGQLRLENGGVLSLRVLATERQPPAALPTARADVVTVREDEPMAIRVLENDSHDDPAQVLRLVRVTRPSLGQATVDAGDSTVTYAPRPDSSGSDLFTYTMRDGQGLTDTDTVRVTILPVNDAPTLNAVAGPVRVRSNAGTQTVRLTGIGPGAPNEAQAVRVTATSSNPAVVSGLSVSGVVNGSATLSFRPVGAEGGSAVIRIAVTDDGGRENGGVDSFSRFLEVIVTAADGGGNGEIPNTAPQIGEVENQKAVEGTAISFEVPVTDEAPDSVEVFLHRYRPHQIVGVEIVGHRITLRPAPGAFTTDIEIKARDNRGAESAGKRILVSWTQAPDANIPPIALPDSVETEKNTVLSIVLAGSDVDGDSLGFDLFRMPEHGQVSGVPPEVQYTPEVDFVGPDSLVFVVWDRADTAQAVVHIRVTELNQAPEAVDDEAVTVQGRAVEIAVLANDRDAEGDALILSGFDEPPNGAVILSTVSEDPSGGGARSLIYFPGEGFVGTDRFAYEVGDGRRTGRAMVVVSVFFQGDFDRNNRVDFADFIQFARHYGTRKGEAGFDARFDLNGDDVVAFEDFLAFASEFGKVVPQT